MSFFLEVELDHSLKNAVSEDPLTVKMLKAPKHL